MTFKQFITVMLASTALAGASWVVVLLNINPEETNILGLLLFYATLFTALVGIFSVAGVGVRVLLKSKEPMFKLVIISSRQGVLASIVILASLAMLSKNIFGFWQLLITISAATAIEFYLSSLNNKFEQ